MGQGERSALAGATAEVVAEQADSDRGEDSWLDGSYDGDDDPATYEHPDPLEGFGMESDMTFW